MAGQPLDLTSGDQQRMARRSADAAFKNYPLCVDLNGRSINLRKISEDDHAKIVEFGSALPEHDRLFLRRDISKDINVERWLNGVSEGRIHSIIAEDEQGIAGYSTIYQTDLEWTEHVADLRVAIAQRVRGMGLGRLLAREAFNIALALDIEKVIARMTLDQSGARNLFSELGFQNEALLKDEVKDRAGQTHDLLIMAVNVGTFFASRQAFGRK
jgi:L-amino acid N-acyltransferase YncA